MVFVRSLIRPFVTGQKWVRLIVIQLDTQGEVIVSFFISVVVETHMMVVVVVLVVVALVVLFWEMTHT